jgi:hypothetical protein
MQLYGISFMQPYKQSGQWQDVFDINNKEKYVFCLTENIAFFYIRVSGSEDNNVR